MSKRGSWSAVEKFLVNTRRRAPNLPLSVTEPFAQFLDEPAAKTIFPLIDVMLVAIHPLFEPWFKNAPVCDVFRGQEVSFQTSDTAEEIEIKGEVVWISTSADEQTRTVKVRVELPNSDGLLRANTFGVGHIVLRKEATAMVVPAEAVHWDGTCNVVFVRDKNYFKADAPKFFHVRSVRPGISGEGLVEIIAGLLLGEVVASTNSVAIQAQPQGDQDGDGRVRHRT